VAEQPYIKEVPVMGNSRKTHRIPVVAAFILLLCLAIPALPVVAGDPQEESANAYPATPTAGWMDEASPPELQPTPFLDYPETSNSRPPSYRAPLQMRPEDHYWFSRPIPSNGINWIDIEYRYGTDFNGEMSSHAGVDLPAKAGTPVLAAADGVVNWAGKGLFNHASDIADPYGLAISIRHDFGYLGQPLFTAYAHLRQIDVIAGQRVVAGQQIGIVGDTGDTTGPHLHFEVRVGEDTFYNTRNPELWLVPPEGYGVLAGRIESSSGWLYEEYSFKLTRLEKGPQWSLLTYSGNVYHADDIYKENFVISDLPAGSYLMDTWIWWKHYYFTIDVAAGQTTFVRMRSGINPEINPPLLP
jgi:murein DD-endopeptidase MepM/ murein hydrolase activator NlpD